MQKPLILILFLITLRTCGCSGFSSFFLIWWDFCSKMAVSWLKMEGRSAIWRYCRDWLIQFVRLSTSSSCLFNTLKPRIQHVGKRKSTRWKSARNTRRTLITLIIRITWRTRMIIYGINGHFVWNARLTEIDELDNLLEVLLGCLASHLVDKFLFAGRLFCASDGQDVLRINDDGVA